MRYTLLGNLEVLADDGTELVIPAPKRRALLAMLLLNANRPVSRERLIDGLWGSEPPDAAMESLFAHVSRLRRELAPNALATVAGGYRLAVEDGALDVEVFERRIAAARREIGESRSAAAATSLRAALALWRGPALGEFEDAPFAGPEAARLDDLRLGALEDLFEVRLALGEAHELVPELEALVNEHPLRERFWGHLMLALYRARRQADALAAYRRLRRILVDDLGIEPSPELQELQRRVLQQEASLAVSSPRDGVAAAMAGAAHERDTSSGVTLERRTGGQPSFAAGLGLGWIASIAVLVGVVIVGAALVQGRAPGSGTPPTGSAATAAPAAATSQIVDEILYSASRPRDENLSCDSIETRLMYASPDGGKPNRITRGGDVFEMDGTWSPDGTRIAFIGNRQDDTSIFVMNADGSALRDLLPTRPPALIPGRDELLNWMVPLFRPTWTADGSKVVFTYAQGGVWSVAPDGSELEQLVPDPAFNAEDFSYAFRSASAVPDGRISIEVSEPGDSDVPRIHLFVADVDGAHLARLSGLPDELVVEGTAWAADGRLAFRGITWTLPEDDPAINLYVVDEPGASPRMLDGTEGITGAPAWSPDGSRLAFTANGDLFTIRTDGSDRTAIVQDPASTACGASWVRTDATQLAGPASTASPGESAPVTAFHRGFLDPGTYEADLLDPPMQLTLGPGWLGTRNAADSLGLAYGWGSAEGYAGYVLAGRIQVVFTSPCPWREGRLIGPTAAEFIDYLQAHETDPGLDVGDPEPVVYGGVTGLAIEVLGARAVTEEQCPGVPPPFRNMHPLFQVGGRDIVLRTGDRMRVVSLDTSDGPAVTFLLVAPTQDFADYTEVAPEVVARFLDAAQPILDGLAFR